jgi:hypothetical protein
MPFTFIPVKIYLGVFWAGLGWKLGVFQSGKGIPALNNKGILVFMESHDYFL